MVRSIRAGVCIICSAMLIICGCEQGADRRNDPVSSDTLPVGLTDPDQTIVAEWTEYLESSDDGAWEGMDEHSLEFSNPGPFPGGEALDVPVYSPFSVSVYMDSLYVTDLSTCQVVALDDSGNLLWKAGGEGEGPGHFPLMTTLAASGRYVAVLNIRLGRIEFFNRDGSFSHNLQFNRAQDIVALDDTTFLVASTEEAGGDIHVLDTDSGVVRSFGEAEIDTYEGIPRLDLLRLCIGGDNRVALFNRYEGLLTIYDIETEECIFRGSRRYPSTPSPPEEYVDADGQPHTMFYPVGGNVFEGPEGMLNVVICNYMDNGSFLSDPECLDFAPVTAVDRYDWDGTYLDSYCLPDSCLNYVVPLPDGRLIARNFAEGLLCQFEQIF